MGIADYHAGWDRREKERTSRVAIPTNRSEEGVGPLPYKKKTRFGRTFTPTVQIKGKLLFSEREPVHQEKKEDGVPVCRPPKGVREEKRIKPSRGMHPQRGGGDMRERSKK